MLAEVKAKRVYLLNVPIDIIKEEDFEAIIKDLLKNDKMNQIVFLTFRGLMRARRNSEYMACVRNASLIVPVSKRLIKGSKFLKLESPVQYHPFPFIIKLLGQIEKNEKSLYLLGAKRSVVQTAENTLRASFPGIQFIGRYAANFSNDYQKNILLAIKKASPSLLLTSRGLKGKDLWLYRNRKEFNPGLFIWEKKCFDVFAGRRKKPSVKNSVKAVKEILKTIIMPWRVLLIFQYFWYIILLIVFRIKNGGK